MLVKARSGISARGRCSVVVIRFRSPSGRVDDIDGHGTEFAALELFSQVGANNLGVALHRPGCSVCDLSAEVEDHHAIGDIHHQAHVVLDQDHGDAELFLDVEDETGDIFGLLEIHPGGRLVEQENLGVHRQCSSQFDSLLHPVREHADQALAEGLDLQEIDDVLGTGPVDYFLTLGSAPVDGSRQRTVREMEMAAEQDVVQHGQILEQFDVLERAGNPQCSDAVGFHAEDALAVEADGALLRVVHTIQTVENRGLAGTVGADDGEQLPRLDLEGHPVESDDARKRKTDILDDEHRTHDNHRFRRL